MERVNLIFSVDEFRQDTIEEEEDGLSEVISDTTSTLSESELHRSRLDTQNTVEDDKEECGYGPFGSWSQCSVSCGGGVQIRLKHAIKKKIFCKEVIRELRWCNSEKCEDVDEQITTDKNEEELTTTTDAITDTFVSTNDDDVTTDKIPDNLKTEDENERETSTDSNLGTLLDDIYDDTRTEITEDTTTEESNPSTIKPVETTIILDNQVLSSSLSSAEEKRNSIKCFSCGSLFSSEAEVCDEFDESDPEQVVECGAGEVCLFYSWISSRAEVNIVRECLPEDSILLGDSRLTASSSCSPQSIDSTSSACTCNTDLCNGEQVEKLLEFELETTTTETQVSHVNVIFIVLICFSRCE